MRAPKFLSFLPLLCVFLSLAVRSADVPKPPTANLGLAVTLHTNNFSISHDALLSGRNLAPFVATATVTNRSRAPISFTFRRPIQPDRFTFRIFNAQSEEIWSSDPGGQPGGPVTSVLPRGKSWQQVQRIPLQIGGAPLAAGRYTVEATLNTDEVLGATTVFEIASPAPKPNGLLKGTVLSTTTQFPGNQFDPFPLEIHALVSGALVTVTQLPSEGGPVGQPFQWQGFSDPNGRFETQVPPGRYRVHSMKGLSAAVLPPANGFQIPPIGLPAFSDGSVEVTVPPATTTRAVVMMGTAAAEKSLVDTVQKVTITQAPADASAWLIDARGMVPTGGWSQPSLVSKEITADGWLILEFIARPPSPNDIVTQAFASVHTQCRIPKLPGLVGVRVKARNSTREAALP